MFRREYSVEAGEDEVIPDVRMQPLQRVSVFHFRVDGFGVSEFRGFGRGA